MTSTSVKDVGAVIGKTASVDMKKAAVSTSQVSFEQVWNQQTDRNSTASESSAGNRKTVQKRDDVDVRDSLKSKDLRKDSVKKADDADDGKETDEVKDLSPEEWEAAMGVLGTAAVDLIQEVADSFDMTVEEVQDLMTDMGMQQTDILQQDNLSKLVLAIAGVEDATSLLTNEELYQQYQALMEQRNALLEESGENLQTDASRLAQMLQEPVETVAETREPLIEIAVEEAPESDRQEAGRRLENGSVQDVAQNAATDSIRNAQAGERAETQTRQHQESSEDKGQSSNLLLQNIKAEQFEPQLQQVSETASAWDSDTMDIMRQIMDYMKIQVKPDMSNLELQLHPASLGTLQIQIASKAGAITAQFVTQNESVKAALESQMIQLKENFAEQGVKVEAIEVTVQTHQFEQNLEQGRGRQQSEPDKRTRTRRIQLNGSLVMDEVGQLEEEEQLTAQMMAASGNTVDYTA